MHAHGDVVGDERNIHRIPDIAEMVHDLGLAGDGVEGRRHDDRVGAGRLCDLRMGDDASVVGSMTPAMHRHAAVDHLDRVLDDFLPRLFVVEHHLAGRAEHEYAMAAGAEQMLEHARVGGIIDREIRIERCYDGRDDTVKFGHFRFLSVVSSVRRADRRRRSGRRR